MAVLRVFLDDKLVEQHELLADSITIGRLKDNDIVLPHTSVSKHHAVIEFINGNHVVKDRNSANGTFLGKQRIKLHQLEYWDELHIADYVLKYMATSRRANDGMDELEEESISATAEDATMVLGSTKVSEYLEPKKKDAKPILLPVAGRDTIPVRYEMGHTAVIIGKSEECHIQVGGFWSPKQLARLEWSGKHICIRPLAQRGLLLNGEKVKDYTQMHDGDRIIAAGIEMEFRYRP